MNIKLDLISNHSVWRGKIKNIRFRIKDILRVAPEFVLVPMPALITFVLSDDEEMHKLNKRWRQKDYPTNVLSFPSTTDKMQADGCYYLGDVIISFTTLMKESIIKEVDFFDHCTHILVHGFLHLCGYDHESDFDASLMESLEVRILNTLNIADPYSNKMFV